MLQITFLKKPFNSSLFHLNSPLIHSSSHQIHQNATNFLSNYLNLSVFAAAGGGCGFTVELIHRDSPKSPMYNPSETHYHRLANALRRSIRCNTTVPAKTEAPIFNNRGEYLMKLSLGTLPFSILAIADTGSDHIWTQCKPCPNCYEQNATMFNPNKSATYKKVECSSSICSFVEEGRTCSVESKCHGDQSHSKGDLAVDTVTMESPSDSVAFSNCDWLWP